MLIPIIKVKDKGSGTEHIVGEDSHDALLTDGHTIRYYNLQNGCGSDYEDSEYEFQGTDIFGEVSIDFVTLEDFIDMNIKSITEAVDNKIAFFKIAKEFQQKRLEDAREAYGIVSDTMGAKTE